MQYNSLRYPGGKFKAVTFSYDDGPRFDIKLADIMNKNGIKGTFNINGGWIGTSEADWHLRAEDIQKYILDAGHEIAIHGNYHRAPGMVSPCLGIQDMLDCRRKLEETFGIIVKGMAYPDCGIRVLKGNNTYEKIREYALNLGIVYARTLGGDNTEFDLPNDFFAWMPSAYHLNPHVLDMIERFNDLTEDDLLCGQPKLFYLWGHSSEFDQLNNWSLFEQICDKLGGHDDYWYATNMEIYNYVEGYNRLVYSADEQLVFNPNLFPIWFEVDKKMFCVKPGETLCLTAEAGK